MLSECSPSHIKSIGKLKKYRMLGKCKSHCGSTVLFINKNLLGNQDIFELYIKNGRLLKT